MSVCRWNVYGRLVPAVLPSARCQGELLERIRTLAEDHQQLPVGAELLDHVRALVDGPDVVVLVHAYGVREREAVAADAELLHERAVLVEFEQPRFSAAHVHEHMPA